MKYFKFFFAFAAFVMLTAVAVQAKTPRIYNGHFFNETPAEMKGKTSRIIMVSTPDGASAIGLYAPVELSTEALKNEIPASEVPQGEELLRRFNEQLERALGTENKKAPELRPGDGFPQFTAVDLNGKTWSNEDVAGKVMVLNLWFTGCGPCRAEMPELSEWKNEMPDVMFFSSTYESPEVARQVLDKGTFNWIPLVSDTQFREYVGNHGYPLTIVAGKDGKVAAVVFGTSPEKRESLKATIASLR